MDGISIITCTGGRPQAFALCERFVARQTYPGLIQWIVVNDVDGKDWQPPQRPGMTVTRIFPEPKWGYGQNTLARNLLAAISCVQFDKVFFLEDDDRFADTYIETLVKQLDHFPIAGEAPARYYHVPSKRYRQLSNNRHASLCQTAIRKSWLPVLTDICNSQSSEFIDVRLWRKAYEPGALIDLRMSVGIKGLPGRPGIGIGHRPEIMADAWKPDPELTVLREWIGDDVRMYQEFIR